MCTAVPHKFADFAEVVEDTCFFEFFKAVFFCNLVYAVHWHARFDDAEQIFACVVCTCIENSLFFAEFAVARPATGNVCAFVVITCTNVVKDKVAVFCLTVHTVVVDAEVVVTAGDDWWESRFLHAPVLSECIVKFCTVFVFVHTRFACFHHCNDAVTCCKGCFAHCFDFARFFDCTLFFELWHNVEDFHCRIVVHNFSCKEDVFAVTVAVSIFVKVACNVVDFAASHPAGEEHIKISCIHNVFHCNAGFFAYFFW